MRGGMPLKEVCSVLEVVCLGERYAFCAGSYISNFVAWGVVAFQEMRNHLCLPCVQN
jgi:hypothetical protein